LAFHSWQGTWNINILTNTSSIFSAFWSYDMACSVLLFSISIITSSLMRFIWFTTFISFPSYFFINVTNNKPSVRIGVSYSVSYSLRNSASYPNYYLSYILKLNFFIRKNIKTNKFYLNFSFSYDLTNITI
jgi:hypothetical protein